MTKRIVEPVQDEGDFQLDRSLRPVRFSDFVGQDRIKENLIHASPGLRYFLLRQNEPYGHAGYVRGKLVDEGLLPA